MLKWLRGESQSKLSAAHLPEGVEQVTEDYTSPRSVEEICNAFEAKTDFNTEDILDR